MGTEERDKVLGIEVVIEVRGTEADVSVGTEERDKVLGIEVVIEVRGTEADVLSQGKRGRCNDMEIEADAEFVESKIYQT